MNIDSIENGYVIDHIKQGKAMEIYNLLDLSSIESQVAIITNAKSKKTGKKDIIKIGELIDLDFNKLAFLDKNLTVNIVENNKVIEKKKMTLPEEISNIAKCKNPRCITSIEQELEHVFILTDKEKEIYRCKYCDTRLEKR